MSQYVEAINAKKAHIASLYLLVMVLLVACAALWYGWKTAPDNIRISIPPDLRTGAIVRPGEFHSANIYAFALSTFRELNRWEENGSVDYGNKIKDLQQFFSPKYREFLINDMESKAANGELRNRSRYALEVKGHSQFEPSFVTPLYEGAWAVNLKVEIVERVAQTESKRISISYPMKVVEMNISPEKNIWGLALDGYVDGESPVRIFEQTSELAIGAKK